MGCSDEEKAARIQAGVDAFFNRDNAEAVEEAFDTSAQVEYAAQHANIRSQISPKLAKPTSSLKDYLVGDIADRVHRPSEVLGEDITGPVLAAYERYANKVAGANATAYHLEGSERQLDPERLSEIKEDSGVYDAIEEARDLIEERFDRDPSRLQYGLKWLEARIEGKGDNQGQDAKLHQQIGGNMSKNLLVNNLRSGLLNHLQLVTTTYPEYGIANTNKGKKLYAEAVRNQDPELNFLTNSRFYDNASDLDKFDFFNRPEHANQGITYFAAKIKALEEGKSESQARAAARAGIEKTQFRSRLGNEPRAYWQEGGKSRLSLMSYGMQMRRLHNGWWLGLAKGMRDGSKEAIEKNGKALAVFLLANGAVNGPTADMPEEVAFFFKAAFPRFYAALRQTDRISLMGLLDADTAELSRIPITNAGWALKAGPYYEKLVNTMDRIDKAMKHPGSPKAWITAMKEASIFAPPIPVIGNKNAGNIAEWAYRLSFGDYDRYTPGGKKYQTNALQETARLFRGRGLGESFENLERDTK